jgi:hypothetical protein
VSPPGRSLTPSFGHVVGAICVFHSGCFK